MRARGQVVRGQPSLPGLGRPGQSSNPRRDFLMPRSPSPATPNGFVSTLCMTLWPAGWVVVGRLPDSAVSEMCDIDHMLVLREMVWKAKRPGHTEQVSVYRISDVDESLNGSENMVPTRTRSVGRDEGRDRINRVIGSMCSGIIVVRRRLNGYPTRILQKSLTASPCCKIPTVSQPKWGSIAHGPLKWGT